MFDDIKARQKDASKAKSKPGRLLNMFKKVRTIDPKLQIFAASVERFVLISHFCRAEAHELRGAPT